MSLKSFLSISLLSLSFVSTHTTTAFANSVAIPIAESRVSIMAYNVENLFDNVDDPEHNDEAYLSLADKRQNAKKQQNTCAASNKPGTFYYDECMNLDWSDSVIETKMTRIADTILSVNQNGADIILLEEVENENILNQLNSKYLKDGKFITQVILQGDDARGINVGLLSKFPLAGTPKIHRIPFNVPAASHSPMASIDPGAEVKGLKTRGILQVDLKLPSGQTLTVFGVHFPSQGKPTIFRQQAVAFLNQLQKNLPAGRVSVVGGDFNIIETEQQLVKDQLATQWLVSHLIGCQACQGTHKYKTSWSFLDILGFSKSPTAASNSGFEPNSSYKLGSGLEVDADSIRVVKSGKYQLDNSGDPARFDEKTSYGVSDHLPIYAELVSVSK